MSTEVAPPAGAPVVPPVAAPVSVAPQFTTWDSADGKLNPAYYDKLPDDVKWVKDELSKYGTRDELVRAFANKTTLAGKKGLIPLPDNAPPEARADRKALLDGINGVPKEAKDYGLTRPAEVPEAAWNQGLADNFTKWAWENSVSPAAMKQLAKVQSEAIKGNLSSQQEYERNFWAEQDKAFDAQIRVEGVPSDKATALIERAATALGFDLKDPKDQMTLKGAKVRLAMMRHALQTGEDSFVAGETARGDGGDPLALASDASHNKANPLYEPLHNPSHPQHKEAKAKLDGWWRQVAAKKK